MESLLLREGMLYHLWETPVGDASRKRQRETPAGDIVVWQLLPAQIHEELKDLLQQHATPISQSGRFPNPSSRA